MAKISSEMTRSSMTRISPEVHKSIIGPGSPTLSRVWHKLLDWYGELFVPSNYRSLNAGTIRGSKLSLANTNVYKRSPNSQVIWIIQLTQPSLSRDFIVTNDRVWFALYDRWYSITVVQWIVQENSWQGFGVTRFWDNTKNEGVKIWKMPFTSSARRYSVQLRHRRWHFVWTSLANLPATLLRALKLEVLENSLKSGIRVRWFR